MNLRTKYDIDVDKRIKNNIECDFNDKNWFVTIMEIAPKTKSQLIELRNYYGVDSQAKLDFRDRYISFFKQVVDIGPMGAYYFNTRADIVIGYYAYEECEFTTVINTGIKFEFNFLGRGFKYGMDDVSCFPIVCAMPQMISINNKLNKPLKLILLWALLENSFRRKILGYDENFNRLYDPEFQGKRRSFIGLINGIYVK
jgi:hypothetical protein